MSSFTESKSHIMAYKGKWCTTKNFKFYFSDNLEGDFIEVPAGFEFDGCSIFCPFGQRVEPDTISSCCLHYFLFSLQKYSFRETNLIFLDSLRVEGASTYKRIKYFLGVTFFGWIIRLKYKYYLK